MSEQSGAKSKLKKVHAIHQKFRSSNPQVTVLVWGLQHTLTELSFVSEHPMIMRDDFKSFSKVRIENHLYNDDILPSKFKFKEYCPLVFRDLRLKFNVHPDDLIESFCLGSNLISEESSGKSSSFFIFTADKKFVAKSISTEEFSQFHSSFAHYHSYIVENDGKTYLPHYLGLYRLTVHDKETYVIIMKNVFDFNLKLTAIFDLKGSTFERNADERELEKSTPTLKDNDFVAKGIKIHLGLFGDSFLHQLENDVNFLSREKLMDYSLLVGIYHPAQDESVDFDPAEHPYAVPRSASGASDLYFLGIIDALTFYGAKKRAANAAKELKHGKDAEISTVNPDQYARRFLEFISANITKAL